MTINYIINKKFNDFFIIKNKSYFIRKKVSFTLLLENIFMIQHISSSVSLKEWKFNCLDFWRHEVAARLDVDWQPSAETDKDVSQNDDP